MTGFTQRLGRITSLTVLGLVAALLAAGCGDNSSSKKDDSGASAGSSSTSSESLDATTAKRADTYDAPPTLKLDPKEKYVVELDTDKGKILVDVDQKAGPTAAANFVFLVTEGFYDGVKFHRIMQNFMIQTGDPTGTGRGGPGYTIKDDKVSGEYDPGTVAMANSGPDTGGSQFFIVQGVPATLGPDYSIFGQVQDKSMSVVDKLAEVEVEDNGQGEMSSPVDDVRITSAKLVSGKLPS